MIESPNITYIRGSRIAEVLGVDKKTVHARALREGWTINKESNRFEYQPPEEVRALCSPQAQSEPAEDGAPRIKFTDLPPESQGRKTALRRQEAVQLTNSIMQIGKDNARRQTVSILVTKYNDFNISTRSLMRWEVDYAKWGIDGLVEQKMGVVGRKGTHVPREFANLGKALVIEHGSVARASRELMTHPELPAQMRERLHEGHMSKSYVTPSIRAAITPAPLTAALAQGPRHARLSDRFTPAHYNDGKAGDVYVADDMTSNIYCWVEWPNANGWRIGQPQILPVLDIYSLRWLVARVIMRDGGQYNACDDIWGLYGDVFDAFGLPRKGFVQERGHWEANAVIGHRTGVSDDDRIGGLASLGLEVFTSYDPRSKIIETAFNQLQYAMDNLPGFAGRDQRHNMPEKLKKQLALLNCKHPVHHPQEFLPHISALSNHLQDVMAKLNQERGDGKVLRGDRPLDKWMEEAVDLREIPESAKWLYRSALSKCQVTKNGVRVTQGSGKKLVDYYYDNPALLTPLKGMPVYVYWNSSNPDADACIMAGNPRKFIGTAKRVKELGRFSATKEELASEAERKTAAMHYARTELRSIQPDMKRGTVPVLADGASVRIGEAMAQAADRAIDQQIAETDLNRIEKKFKKRALVSTETDDAADISNFKSEISDPISPRVTAPTVGITDQELNEL